MDVEDIKRMAADEEEFIQRHANEVTSDWLVTRSEMRLECLQEILRACGETVV